MVRIYMDFWVLCVVIVVAFLLGVLFDTFLRSRR